MKPKPAQPENDPCSVLAERQAIMEFDGCMPREVAEARAKWWMHWQAEREKDRQGKLF